MSAHSCSDHEPFESLLANAFLVQQIAADARSGAAVTELLHLVRAGKVDFNSATDLIAELARDVANAAGVAVGILNGDQLLYQSGSGRAADLVGRKVMATLSVSTKAEAKREILRVDDAEKELGVGAAICRQFEARSLLILPIYHNHGLAGVLDIFFSEAHTYVDREILTYQLMTRIIAEAMEHSRLSEQKDSGLRQWSGTPEVPRSTDYLLKNFPKDSPSPTDAYPMQRSDTISVIQDNELPRCRPSPRTSRRTVKSRPWQVGSWRIADWAAMFIVLVTSAWIASTHEQASPRFTNSQRQTSKILDQQALAVSDKLMPVKKQSPSVPVVEEGKVADGRRRVRVGNTQTDYFSDAVVVRHLLPNVAVQQIGVLDYEVQYISDDVTVWRFNRETSNHGAEPPR
jgi:putative methionine-R-sulfoxide reductase with GAF domain